MKHLKKITLIPIIAICLYLLQFCSGGNYNSYIEDYEDIAIKEMIRTGYPASIKLAQAILESEGGRSKLAFEFNNHFGIQCGQNWPGKKHYEEEDYGNGEVVETCYRVYNDPNSSFIAHTDLLRESKHYRSLFKIDPMDYVSWAEKLGELGYADNDTYDNTIINIIEKYNLYEYDEIATRRSGKEIATKDYESERALDGIDERTYESKRRGVDSYEERMADLEDNITDHRSKYEEARRQAKESIDRLSEEREYLPEARAGQKYKENVYENNRHLDYDRYTNDEAYDNKDSYGTSNYDRYSEGYNKDAYTSRYEENYPNKKKINEAYTDKSRETKRSRYEEVPIDSKYDGYSEGAYNNARPSSEYPKRSNNYHYEQPIASKHDSEPYWSSLSNDETSIDDFKMPEDYAYINGVKVTTARYDDTPMSIAARYNVSVKDIIQYNEEIGSTRQLLREGTKVYLQAKKKNYENGKSYHIVQFGERMQGIAQMYGLSLDALYQKNKMPPGSEPALGEKIKLDRGRVKKSPELRANYRDGYAPPTPLTPPSRVAIKKQTAPIAKTPITDNYPNRVLVDQEVPVTTVLLQPVSTNVMYHTVQEGETLYRIAHQYGITVTKIRNMNHLNNDSISKGMRLKIR